MSILDGKKGAGGVLLGKKGPGGTPLVGLKKGSAPVGPAAGLPSWMQQGAAGPGGLQEGSLVDRAHTQLPCCNFRAAPQQEQSDARVRIRRPKGSPPTSTTTAANSATSSCSSLGDGEDNADSSCPTPPLIPAPSNSTTKVGGEDVFCFDTFRDLTPAIPGYVQDNLAWHKLTHPMPIQKWGIAPAIQEGADVIGIAKTGSGKTLAFLLPAVVYLERDLGNKALVLAPTRELADQIHKEWVRRFYHVKES